MNKILLFLTLFLGLHATHVQSMEQAQKSDLMATFKNSPAAKWLNKYKTPLMIGVGGLIAARLVYSHLATPTPEQVKEQIRKTTAGKVKLEALHVRDMHNKGVEATRGILLNDFDPYYGYNVTIVTNADEQNNKPQFLARYTYNCDKTTEDIEILFEDQEAQLLEQ